MLWVLTRFKDFNLVFYSCIIFFFFLPVVDWRKLMPHLTFLNFNLKVYSEDYTSVFCRGNNHTDRLCKFKNLCYNSQSKNFIFFHSYKSEIVGLTEDNRFSPAVLDFSSVYDHNTQYFNFIDLPSSSFSNFSVNYVNGVALLFKRFNPDNLMHVFHDDLVPAYVTLKENFLLSEKSVYFVFADGREPGPYSYIYKNFLDEEPMYLSTLSSQVICFEKAIVGLNKHSLWYQYGFREPQGPLNKDMVTLYPILVNFRAYFIKQFHLNDISDQNTTLLLDRKNNRKILNTKEVVETIKKITNFKTHVISLENYSVTDIIQKIRGSKLVVGMHGSLLILSLFLPQNSYIIELFPYGVNPSICTPYKTLAQIPGLELIYHSWENKIEENSIPHPEYPPDLGGIMHLSDHMQELIKRSVVKPFLCCYNAEWLYRIYQDTFVDLKSFSSLIKVVDTGLQMPNSNESIKVRLFPSEVQNISCHLNSKNIYTISWEKPWNLNFINVTTIEYELWYQTTEREDIKAFIMKKTSFSFQEDVSDLYIWIRCHVDGRIGPFNVDPLICQK